MKHIIYLDNSATTKPCEKAVKYINEALLNTWGNPSSLHGMGIESEILVNRSREFIAKTIAAKADEIIFTGSGTEANNTAIMTALFRKGNGNRIITSNIEHPSVMQAVKRLEDLGFEVIRLNCNNNGCIDLDELRLTLNEKTVLLSIMLVNNEIGSIQPIEKVSKLVRNISPKAFIHCDAVQAYGKMPINVKSLGVDLMTASAHKIHGPKGIGFLYCRKGVPLTPYIMGGGQEHGMRSGTEAVPLIAGFLGAVDELGDIENNHKRVTELNLYAREIFSKSGLININSPKDALPYILNISIEGYRSETMLHFLESKGIYVSSGSACAKGQTSYVLSALGLSNKRSDSALRLSFSKTTNKEDIDLTLAAIKEAVCRLRRSSV